MKFAAAYWLWSLLLLPLIYGVMIFDEKRRKELFGRFANPSRWAFIAPEMDPNHRVRRFRLWLLALGFAVIALARPQFGTHEETVNVTGLDVMVVLDVSNSMEVEDVVPNRLQKAKHLIRTLVDRLEGDRVGLVAFAGSSYVASPLTTDLAYLIETSAILNPRMVHNQGTNIGNGLETALSALERGAVEAVTKKSGTAPSHAVILISDGEDHEAKALSVASKFKETGTRLYVLGVGTEKGGPIPIKDESGNPTGYKKDKGGQPVVSAFRADALQKISEAAGGKYWTVTTGEGELSELLNDIGALNRSDYAERRYLVYEDRFQIPLFIAICLLFWELSIPARKIVALLFLLIGSYAQADEVIKKPARLDAYLENQKGIKAFKEGKIEEAQKSFGSAQARDPMRPELEFNQGVVEFQQGEVDKAIESFNTSAQAAKQKRDDGLFGKSMYNLGNAYAKKGDMKNAIRAYSNAIRSALEQKDSVLENEARKNLQLLVNETKKQQQKQKEQQQENQKKQEDQGQSQDQKKDEKESQQQEKKDEQEEKKKNQQDQSKEREKDSDQDQKDKQNQKDEKGNIEKQENRQYQESQKQPGKQQFQSKKMSPEDADRVMSELTNKERQLQEKLQTKGRSEDNEKNW